MKTTEKQLWVKETWTRGIDPLYAIFFILVIITIVTFVFSTDPESRKIKQFDNLSKGFSILSIVMLVYIVYVNIDHNGKIEEQTIRQQSFQISKEMYLSIVDQLAHDYPETYFLANEVQQFDDRSTEELEKIIQYNPDKRKVLEDYYCNALIQTFEDFLNLKRYLIVDQFGWIRTFYYMYYSKILQKRWEGLQSTYSPITNKIIEQFIQIKQNADKLEWDDAKVDEELAKIDYTVPGEIEPTFWQKLKAYFK